MTAERIEPTPEDTLIFQRNFRRVLRWNHEVEKARGEKTGPYALIITLRAATGDYLEFGAGLDASGAAITTTGLMP